MGLIPLEWYWGSRDLCKTNFKDMEVLSIQGLMVKEVSDVRLNLIQSPSGRELHIRATGFNKSEGWSKPVLELRDYDFPPVDGIYDFDFMARAPKNLIAEKLEKLLATYIWTDFPENLRGVRVHAGENSILKML